MESINSTPFYEVINKTAGKQIVANNVEADRLNDVHEDLLIALQGSSTVGFHWTDLTSDVKEFLAKLANLGVTFKKK